MNDDYIIKQAEKERDEFLQQRKVGLENSIPPLKTLGLTLAETKSEPKIYSWQEFINQEDDNGVSWLIEDILRPGWLAVIGGHGKHGKSTLATYLLNALRLGTFFINSCQPTPVIYLNCEMADEDIKGLIRDVVGDKTSDGESSKVITQLKIPLDLSWLYELLTKEEKPGVCVIDSFRGAFLLKGDSENEAGTVGHILRQLQLIARKTGWTIIVIHHSRKSGSGDALDLAGSGEWTSAPDVMLTWHCPNFKEPGTLAILGRVPPCEPLSIKLSREKIEFLGTVTEHEVEGERQKILDSLTEDWTTSDDLAEEVKLPKATTRRRLGELLEIGRVVRQGEGKKGNPYLWAKSKTISLQSTIKQFEVEEKA